VQSASGWRALALAHPVHKRPDSLPTDPAGLASDVAPDWVAVARQWDGVHLGFGGLLAASLRPLGPPGEVTVLWTWECEQTVWVREAFTGRAALPPLTEPPPLPRVDIMPFELAAAARDRPSVGYLPAVEPDPRAEPGLVPPEARHRRPHRRWFRR
jgi:hypothetical protein